MKKSGYYSSGEFARMAHVTLRTVRYYDKYNILKPSFLSESGARFYTDEDFSKLQQILLLKYLGFSLVDIKELIIGDSDSKLMLTSLNIQLKLIQDQIDHMHLVEKAIQDTTAAIRTERSINWSNMLHLIHLTGMEKSLKKQYQDASNISARINLHSLYSHNQKGWFPWIYEQCLIQSNIKILEIGCGDGTLWTANLSLLPAHVQVILNDISEGMIRDAHRAIGASDSRFSYESFDCKAIPYKDESFDLVIANHVLFYCDDIPLVCSEVRRVLKSNGRFICSTYGNKHMKEISLLVQSFDNRIALSSDILYERFGSENGSELLRTYFSSIEWITYDDYLYVTEPEPLISYILSCHGNQNQYILDRYKEFLSFVKKKTDRGFHITKDAGIFLCIK